jgi:threonine dehydratase
MMMMTMMVLMMMMMWSPAGNHALALSWHGRQLGIPVTVFMPTVAPLTKVGRG